ncbi:DUF3373 family protein [Peredibacter starrii]|uniref:DUF3373 family protein n=1 Tax=Peredibacter starrii TaxID=28202 RepID=A0AAX4HN17_9BACT|nr:DUF3373 family protein [Peredibacter starrii]WPU64284.1 DUF3373 family protein [Peredibacter starrii]
MKKFISSLAVLALTAPAFAQDTKALESRIEALELSRDLNWVKLGGSLETRYDYIDYERNKGYSLNGAAVNKGGRNDSYYRMWANVNMEAKPSDRLTFFGRLSMAKYFSVLGSNGQPTTDFADLGDGQNMNRSFLFMERAFVNYSIDKNWTFTMGRLPTIDGPNKHIALNQQIMGNYPTLAYSAILDGFALTYATQPTTDSVLRTKLIYTPLQNVNYAGTGSSNLKDGNGDSIRTSSDFVSLLVEYEKYNASWFKKNMTIFQALRGEQTPFYQPPFDDGNPVTETTGSDLYVSVNRFVLYTDFEKIAGTNFDLAAQVMYSIVNSRGSLVNNPNSPSTTIGWGTDKRSDDQTGYASVITARYQLDLPSLNRPKIGAEWFHSSEDAYVYDAANVNPINMYGSQDADVYHVFYNHTFDGGLALNTGYMYRKQNSVRGFSNVLGKNQDADNKDQNVYVSLLATF